MNVRPPALTASATMSLRVRPLVILLTACLSGLGASASHAQSAGYSLARTAVTAGGGTSAASSLTLSASAGDLAPGVMTGNAYLLEGGYWAGLIEVPPPSYEPPSTPAPLPSGGGSATLSGGTVTLNDTGTGAAGSLLTLGGAVPGSSGPPTTVQMPGGAGIQVGGSAGTQLQVARIGGAGSPATQPVLAVLSGSATFVSQSGFPAGGAPLATAGGVLVSAQTGGVTATIRVEPGSAPVIETGPGAQISLSAGSSLVTGTALQLSPGAAGSDVPVRVSLGEGQPLLAVSTGSAGAAFVVEIRTIGGVPTPILRLTAGSATLRVPAAGATGLATSAGPILAEGDTRFGLTRLDSGELEISLTSGSLLLPVRAPSAARGALTARAAEGAEAAILTDGRLYAGETVRLDPAGGIATVFVGSAGGNQGLAGDGLASLPIAGFGVQAWVPRLDGRSERLAAPLDQVILGAMPGAALVRPQAADGIGTLLVNDGRQTFSALPLGRVTVDQRRPDGATLVDNGQLQVSRQGVAVTLAPAIADPAALAAFVRALGGSLTLQSDGSYLVHTGGRTFALQPGYEVRPGTAGSGLGLDAGGSLTYTDPAGRQQTLHAAAADFAGLREVLRGIDPQAVVYGNADGTIRARLAGGDFTLLPDYELIPDGAPQAPAGRRWWVGSDGRVFLSLPAGGLAQGFRVR